MIIEGDCLEKMRNMEDNSIDFIVCDPPYGLNFMGKDWDGRIPSIEIWAEALRIAKPGSMLAAFGGTRTHHHLMLGIEGAGWEIRDCVFWLYGSGFPKSHNFGRKLGGIWEGYGTALKPAVEPIILAMKPLDGTYVENAQKWDVAGINIDESRIGTNEILSIGSSKKGIYEGGFGKGISLGQHEKGRWPANLILDEESAQMLYEMKGISKSTKSKSSDNHYKSGKYGDGSLKCDRKPENSYNDSGSASRFFYCAKASSSERNKGLEGMPIKEKPLMGEFKENPGRSTPKSSPKARENHHPTVKPIALMKYILKLLAPPGNPVCLDPFAGSGSTLVAAKELGIRCIGIEKEPEYCEIARKRLEAA